MFSWNNAWVIPPADITLPKQNLSSKSEGMKYKICSISIKSPHRVNLNTPTLSQWLDPKPGIKCKMYLSLELWEGGKKTFRQEGGKQGTKFASTLLSMHSVPKQNKGTYLISCEIETTWLIDRKALTVSSVVKPSLAVCLLSWSPCKEGERQQRKWEILNLLISSRVRTYSDTKQATYNCFTAARERDCSLF